MLITDLVARNSSQMLSFLNRTNTLKVQYLTHFVDILPNLTLFLEFNNTISRKQAIVENTGMPSYIISKHQ